MNVSVVMATYNGEKYIREQIESVVKQLSTDDELIISDDGSSDGTKLIIQEYVDRYENVKMIDGPGKGVVENFSNAITKLTKDIVFICDQDDIWCDDKVETIKKTFEENKNIKVILHDAKVCDENGNIVSDETIFEKRKAKHGVLRNIIFSTYYGCCMAIRRDYIVSLLPLPENVLYDQYIGNCAEIDKCTLFVAKTLIYHREHNKNWSKKQDLIDKIKIRLNMVKGMRYYLRGK